MIRTLNQKRTTKKEEMPNLNDTTIIDAQTDFGFGTGSFVVSQYHCAEFKKDELGIVISHRTVLHDIGPEEMYWVIFERGDAIELSSSDLCFRTKIYRGRFIQAAKHYHFVSRNQTISDARNRRFSGMFDSAYYFKERLCRK